MKNSYVKAAIVGATALMISATTPSIALGQANQLVNTQEISLEGIDNIDVKYTFATVSLFKSPSDKLIVKEFMSSDKPRYYAQIGKSGSTLTIDEGLSLCRVVFRFNLRVRIEIYIPAADSKNITVSTTNGSIRAEDIVFAGITMKSSSGSVSAKGLAAAASIATLSGSIDLQQINGSVNATTTSGKLHCGVAANAGNIRLSTTSGSVKLDLPANFTSRFAISTSSGRITTPFRDKLNVSDKSAEGVIGGDMEVKREISIKTVSGAIQIMDNG